MTNEDCWMCGDGVERNCDGWAHSDDLGIDLDGKPAVTACTWGKPYAPKEFS